jgi:hypothetical protein
MRRKELEPKKKTNTLLVRIKEAQNQKDWGEVSGILGEATVNDKDDIAELKSIIPDLVLHHEWLVRASTVEFIGDFRLRKFENLVKERLQDSNSIVRSYALMAYYDIKGAKSLPVIKEFCEIKDVALRLTALGLLFIKTGDMDAFKKLSKILTRKRCKPIHRSASTNFFDFYCNAKQLSEVVKLYEEILPDIPKTHWSAKDIQRMLKKWKQSK